MADRFGDKIGPRLAQLIGAHVLAARRDHAPIEAKIRQTATQALIDKAGLEVAEHIAPLLAGAIDANPDMHPEVKAYLLRTASGKHQLQAIAGHLAMAGAGSVLGTLLSNELAPFAYAVVGANPHLRLDPQTAALAHATGLLDYQGLVNEIAGSGLDANRATIIGQAAQAVPDAATIGELVNRGELSEQDALYWIQRGGYGPALHGPLLSSRRQLLTVADAALAVLRGNIGDADGRAIAAANGMRAGDFETFVANTGEPLGLADLYEARRRGFIDQARFARGFRQSRYRDEWLPVAEQLQFAPMSTADAIDAAVQNHLSVSDARDKARQNGLEPADFDALYQTAGEPLSRTELEQLYNRGEIDAATVRQGLRESRLKDKYVDDALKLHTRLPEGRQIVSMVTHGVVTKPAAIALLLEIGYSPEVAADLVAEGTAAKLVTHKALTVAEIHQLYTAGVFGAGEAGQLLAGLGYDAADTGYLLKSWDLLAAAAITRQAIGVVRNRYVARHFDHQAAVLYLHSLHVAPAAVERYLTLWDIEREATVAVLSEAQIVKAHKEGLISGDDAYGRLTGRGYSPDDARILLGVAPGSELPA